MENEIKKFLEFNGKVIYFLGKEGQYWIAIKPICEALGVDFEYQRKALKNDAFWDQLPSNQAVVAADNRIRKMLCLPEQYIYGWLCSITSSNPELIAYKRKCYQLLYEYFHGTITGRKELIVQKAKVQIEKERLIAELQAQPAYQKLQELAKNDKRINTELKAFDRSLLSEQLWLFSR